MIPGITDQSRLPRIGKIRLGEKASTAGGKEYPKALPYFSFRDVPQVSEVYGAACVRLSPVLFPSDDEDVFFPTARACYGRSGLFCKCRDGKTASRVFVGEKDSQGVEYAREHRLELGEGELYELPCLADSCPWTKRDLCKPLGRLLFMLPKVPGFGVFEIATTSFHSMVNVLSVVRAVRSVVGRVAGIPFALRLMPQQVQPDGKAKTVHVLSLEVEGTLAELLELGRRISAGGGIGASVLPAPQKAPALPISGTEDLPDDLYPEAGAGLDQALGLDGLPTGPPRPPVAELDESFLDDAAPGEPGEADDLPIEPVGREAEKAPESSSPEPEPSQDPEASAEPEAPQEAPEPAREPAKTPPKKKAPPADPEVLTDADIEAFDAAATLAGKEVVAIVLGEAGLELEQVSTASGITVRGMTAALRLLTEKRSNRRKKKTERGGEA